MASPQQAKADADREAEYRAKDDARTLTEAEAIHKDENRLAGAHKHLQNAKEALHGTLRRINRRVGRAKATRASSKK